MMSFKVNAPEYVFLISQLAGERRFASAVAKRLEGLGALTHGDRRATETCDLSQFNVFTKFGRSALRSVMGAVGGTVQPKVPPRQTTKAISSKVFTSRSKSNGVAHFVPL